MFAFRWPKSPDYFFHTSRKAASMSVVSEIGDGHYLPKSPMTPPQNNDSNW